MPSPWIPLEISATSLIVSCVVAAHAIVRQYQDRRDGKPQLLVQAQPWYEECGDGVVLSNVQVLAVNVGAAPATVTEVGIEPVDISSVLSFSDRAGVEKLPATVAQGETLTWSTPAREYYELLDGRSEQPDRVQFRTYAQGLGRRGEVRWRSSPISIEARHRPPSL